MREDVGEAGEDELMQANNKKDSLFCKQWGVVLILEPWRGTLLCGRCEHKKECFKKYPREVM